MYHSFLDLLRYKIKYFNKYKNVSTMKSMLIKFIVNKIQHECYYSFKSKLGILLKVNSNKCTKHLLHLTFFSMFFFAT